MNLRPLHDRVLVRRIEQEEKTAGGIIIPDTAQEKPMEGEIVAVGTGPGQGAGPGWGSSHRRHSGLDWYY